ncbi:MAG: hypothetical protein PVF46_03570, partial [Lysobacterales bacterium]
VTAVILIQANARFPLSGLISSPPLKLAGMGTGPFICSTPAIRLPAQTMTDGHGTQPLNGL